MSFNTEKYDLIPAGLVKNMNRNLKMQTECHKDFKKPQKTAVLQLLSRFMEISGSVFYSF